MSKNYIPQSAEPVVVKQPNSTIIIYVKLQLNVDAHAHYDGKVSGRHYEWAKAGSIVEVDSLDAPYLLEKRIKSQACCSGSSSDTPVFITVD